MNAALERAAANIPAWKERKVVNASATAALGATLADLPTNDQAYQNVVARTRRLLELGEEIPDDIGREFVELKLQYELRATRESVLRYVAAQTDDSDHLISSNLDVIFAGLQEQMDELTAAVRTAAPSLSGARTAQEAIDAGPAATEAWATLNDLVDQYDEIRQAQMSLYLSRVQGVPMQVLVRGGLFENALDVHPYFVFRRQSTTPAGDDPDIDAWLRSGLTMLDFPRWTDTSGEQGWWLWEPRIEHLLWVASQTRAWVPSPQLAFKMLELGVQATSGSSGAAVRSARDEYRARAASHSTKPTSVPSMHSTQVGTARKGAIARGHDKSQMPNPTR